MPFGAHLKRGKRGKPPAPSYENLLKGRIAGLLLDLVPNVAQVEFQATLLAPACAQEAEAVFYFLVPKVVAQPALIHLETAVIRSIGLIVEILIRTAAEHSLVAQEKTRPRGYCSLIAVRLTQAVVLRIEEFLMAMPGTRPIQVHIGRGRAKESTLTDRLFRDTTVVLVFEFVIGKYGKCLVATSLVFDPKPCGQGSVPSFLVGKLGGSPHFGKTSVI